MGYLTGFHAIEEWLKADGAGGALLVAKAGPRARELIDLAVEKRVRVDRVGAHELDRLAPDHRGIALTVEEGGAFSPAGGKDLSLDDFIAGLGERREALAVILDEITDPHNYGAILRSCDQFGADLVITRKRRIAKHAEVIARSSAGASAWVPIAEVANLPRAVQDLKGADFWVYGADMGGKPAWDLEMKGRIALILGGEGTGLTRLLRETCDDMAAIPARGRIDSLNVSVAAGVLLYEIARQRKKRK
jgi:23S rRNA (guanosine2251-2'-O)-methyltransferase